VRELNAKLSSDWPGLHVGYSAVGIYLVKCNGVAINVVNVKWLVWFVVAAIIPKVYLAIRIKLVEDPGGRAVGRLVKHAALPRADNFGWNNLNLSAVERRFFGEHPVAKIRRNKESEGSN
jgi:hypothetical protein